MSLGGSDYLPGRPSVKWILCTLKVHCRIRCSSIHFLFSKVSTEDSYGCHDIDSSLLSFLRFNLETDVEVDEGSAASARNWLFTTLLVIDSMVVLVMDLTELSSF